MRATGCLIGAACLLGACAAPGPVIADGFAEPREQVDILVMPPDIDMGLMTLSGTQSREEWDRRAAHHLMAALIAQLEAGGEDVHTLGSGGHDSEDLRQLYLLHRAIMQAVLVHEVEIDTARFAGPLPHRPEGRYDYTLGEAATRLAGETPADYAVFLTSRARLESGGMLVSKLLVGAVTGQAPPGHGFRGTLVSLVDLGTGRLVWLGASDGGDARDPQAAAKIMKRIFRHSPLD